MLQVPGVLTYKIQVGDSQAEDRYEGFPRSSLLKLCLVPPSAYVLLIQTEGDPERLEK